MEQQPSIAEQSAGQASSAPPADAPRDVASPAVRRRAWTEPRVRLWWVLGLGIALITLYVLATKTADWWAERSLLTNGTAVQAVILRATDALNDITVENKQMRPDSVCVLRFELNGKTHEVRGQLPEHIEQGKHVVTGPMNPVTLHVDPNDPTRWTDRTASPPFFSRQMIGVAIGAPIAVLLMLVALIKRRGVLGVWRDGRPAPALVIGTGQTPVAPRSRAVRCTPADSTDKRVFTVYLPAGAAPVAPGDVLWVVRPAEKPEPCYAAGWFERDGATTTTQPAG